ncbi:hypothetical protein NTD86_05040 [Pseudomonas sp. 7P_10.2_Bac1]|uniref:hypothetical protein n=1 Tax=Pseudomonas sp. 7P_10.2_Bac1 TaxID=2971614 RepID=UPI0021C721AB|nr:hypothetical protein [Pseudomonas sp. 7P_10.2_Bac1]MCU1726353.1 hypothetical protein [Pseudomonas sp. 7P_10.2_Bac1]
MAISLSKNQTNSLVKAAGARLEKVCMEQDRGLAAVDAEAEGGIARGLTRDAVRAVHP